MKDKPDAPVNRAVLVERHVTGTLHRSPSLEGIEDPAYTRQHDDYVNALRANRIAVEEVVVEHHSHFDLPFDLTNPGTVVGGASVPTALPPRIRTCGSPAERVPRVSSRHHAGRKGRLVISDGGQGLIVRAALNSR